MMPNYASFGRRLVAGFLDGIIVQIATTIIGVVLSAVGGATGDDTVLPTVGVGLSLVIALGYYIYFIGSRGQTPGKMALGIKVVKVGTQQVPGYLGAFLREIVGKILSSLIFGLGYLWMLWDAKKQTWHDKIAGTVVLKV